MEAINKRPLSTSVYPRTGIPLTPFRSQAKLVETIRWTVPAPIPPIATSFRSPCPSGRDREPDGPLEVNLAHHRRGCIRSQPRPGSAITAGRVPALTGLTQSRRDNRSRPAAIPDKTTRSTQLRSRLKSAPYYAALRMQPTACSCAPSDSSSATQSRRRHDLTDHRGLSREARATPQ